MEPYAESVPVSLTAIELCAPEGPQVHKFEAKLGSLIFDCNFFSKTTLCYFKTVSYNGIENLVK